MNPSGTVLCARYAFAPNYYHYCGPDTRGNFGEYVSHQTADEGLVNYIEKFEMLYPYLTAIAHANGLAEPLDTRVVEAYWVGNSLLTNVKPAEMYQAFTDYLHLDETMKSDQYKWLLPKIDQGVTLHHSFNVFDVFLKKSAQKVQLVVESMDQCRIGWGKVIDKESALFKEKRDAYSSHLPMGIAQSNIVLLETQRLVYQDGKLKFVPDVREVAVMYHRMRDHAKPGVWLSYHWGIVCDVLTTTQVKRLAFYTNRNLAIANKTL